MQKCFAVLFIYPQKRLYIHAVVLKLNVLVDVVALDASLEESLHIDLGLLHTTP
jgi:hypothetical protein